MMKQYMAFIFILSILSGCLVQGAPDDAERDGLSSRTGTVLNVRELYAKTPRQLFGKSSTTVYEADFLEITIMLDNGQEILTRQDADDFFKKGDRVRLLTGSGDVTTVQHE